MLALIQRVSQASVSVDGHCVGHIGQGLLALVAVQPDDNGQRVERMADKLLAYRVFDDGEGRMNRSLSTIGGGLLLVSQFTLAADTRTGLRPSFSSAAKPEIAEALFEQLVACCRARHPNVETGQFRAHMQVSLCNDGPVTFLLQT